MAKPYAPLLQQLLLEFKSQRLGSAEQIAKAIIKRNPKDLVALQILGLSLAIQGRVKEAIDPLTRAVKGDPNNPELLSNLAKAQHTADYHLDAIKTYEELIKLLGPIPEILMDMGTSYAKIRDYESASGLFNKVIDQTPDNYLIWSNRGNLLAEQKLTLDAITSYEKSIQLNPNYAEAWTNLGNALFDLGHHEKSIECHECSLAIDPNYAEAWFNKGNNYLELKKMSDAYDCFQRAFSIKRKIPYLFGQLYAAKMSLNKWDDLANFETDLIKSISLQKPTTLPFNILTLPELGLQRIAAEVVVANRYPSRYQNNLQSTSRSNASKIRLAYFSSDFNDHPVGILMDRLLQLHHKSDFELIGVYLKSHSNSPLVSRLKSSFDDVICIEDLGDLQAEKVLLSKNIDIAVDLNGHTAGLRMQVFANRIAPLQINYLGYAGTSGANYFDYIICDETSVPKSYAPFFSEKLAYLPNSFFPADSSINEFDSIPSRQSQGLPSVGFVFSCFNNSYKLNPSIFAIWMSLLQQVPNSVLWLSSHPQASRDNLNREMERYQVSPERVIFANRVASRTEHLSRLRCADLFLDTPNYNAHATSADSLWAGVPVLTMVGTTFAGRVAASHLNALGLQELIVDDLIQYTQLAYMLATNPEKLNQIKIRLNIAKKDKPFFDTAQYVKDIESLYKLMFDRACKKLPPAHIRLN
ncbi:MAG: tetratricopeptide repeat protein [Burkholderiaceae bacterium]|nr:tetratricopeptide repeat protein [Burkholderiaceae bacterium]